ncbi:MAG: lysylphosphatidylglycerol synthase domain-containing protein [Rhodanobacteraceae bacterium]
MKRRYHLIGLVAGLVVTVVFIAYVARSLRGHDLAAYVTPRAFAGIGLAALFYCLSLPLIAWAWRDLLRGLAVFKSWRELTAILAITQFAKYLPGNIGQYVGRTAMSLSRGIGLRAFGVTVVIEMVSLMGAALVVGIGAGLLSNVGFALARGKDEQIALICAVLVAAIIGLVLFRTLAPRILQRFTPQHAHLLEGSLLPPRLTLIRAFLFYCATYCMVGIGIIALAHLLLPSQAHDNWLLVASFALAWVVGFVTPGAPAGLGVREGLLLLMLGPIYTPALAGILIIALRLATTLGDAINFVVGLILLPKKTQPPAAVPSSLA